MDSLAQEISRRRTFAIISHPDAGKTTITEKLLLIAAVLQRAGEVRGRGATGAYARSDWMAMEKERGISVTTSVMQFPYRSCIINLLDTPGHEDFSEDTYRVLTAVDALLMVIDAARGVEERTRRLMDVARLRTTPVVTFMNKLDRDSRDPLELLDEVEKELGLRCTPVTWPIGSGKEFRGVCHRQEQQVYLYRSGEGHHLQEHRVIAMQDAVALRAALGEEHSAQLADELELLEAGTPPFDEAAFRRGELTPVFFGTALGNFGVDLMLDGLTAWAPSPQSRQSDTRLVEAREMQFSGFIFKIQANMDPRHRDRIAFLRIVSGRYQRGMQLYHVRARRQIQVADAVTFMAESREMASSAVAGDIIGLYNHGTIRIGDTFTAGEELHFSGIPDFAPELFRKIRLRDPLRQKQLLKGLLQLSEEGAVQVFRPLNSNELIVGAVGVLQFDVVVSRLRHEYAVEALYEPVAVATARWVSSSDEQALEELRRRVPQALAMDGGGHLTYLASSTVNLNLTMERHPQVTFEAAREH